MVADVTALYLTVLVVIAETEDALIKRLNEWKNNVENRGMRVNMNKTKVMISGFSGASLPRLSWKKGC